MTNPQPPFSKLPPEVANAKGASFFRGMLENARQTFYVISDAGQGFFANINSRVGVALHAASEARRFASKARNQADSARNSAGVGLFAASEAKITAKRAREQADSARTSAGNAAVFSNEARRWSRIVGSEKPEDNATDNSDALTATVLLTGVRMEQSDGGEQRLVGLGIAGGFAADGDAVTFSTAWASTPIVKMGSGGLTFDQDTLGSGSGVQQYQSNVPTGLSTSGFTASCRLKSIGTSLTNETDGDGTGTENAWGSGHGDPDWRAGKEDANEADNDTYTFRVDYKVGASTGGSEPIDGEITLGFYTYDGASFVQRATLTDSNTSGSVKTVTNKDVDVTQDGLTTEADGSGDTYGVHVEESLGVGGGLTDVQYVKWSHSTSPGNISSTPAGTSEVSFWVGGNTGSV